jgi:acetate kinase
VPLALEARTASPELTDWRITLNERFQIAAPAWQGATTENTGGIWAKSNAARRDARPKALLDQPSTGHEHPAAPASRTHSRPACRDHQARHTPPTRHGSFIYDRRSADEATRCGPAHGVPAQRGHLGGMGDSTQRSGDAAAVRSILAVNSGSSSIKFALFGLDAEPQPLWRGTLADPDRATAIEQLMERIAEHVAATPLAGVGHRIVHGGPNLREPQLVTGDLLQTLGDLVRLAPNHLPDELHLIDAVQRLRPDLPQFVCFDTAFHADLPEVARHVAIPREFAAEGVRRYGFHGLSYTFLMDELRRAGPSHADGRVVLAHLGSGSSLAAVRGGRPVDTSMGFTPIGGVVMSTRSGDLDPGVVTFIARTTGFDADRVEYELGHRSGLLGISGTAEMRDLLARETADESCRIAVSIYCYEIKKRIGAYAAALGGLDALVFSGGIGEHAGTVRSRICGSLEFLGVEIDEGKNAANAPVISTSSARVVVHVIPTDEELVIARAGSQLLQRS